MMMMMMGGLRTSWFLILIVGVIFGSARFGRKHGGKQGKESLLPEVDYNSYSKVSQCQDDFGLILLCVSFEGMQVVI